MSEVYVVIRDMADGNESVGEMWQETKIFPADATLDEVMAWALSEDGDYSKSKRSPSKKRITITRPHS